MKLRFFLPTAALAVLAACASTGTPAAAPRDGESLVRAMYDRYAGRWYRTLAFTQKTTFSPPDRPERVEMWEEYARLPGALRIERGGGRGAIYVGDSTFIVAGDSVVRRLASRNELMTLGFDVYTQDPAVTVRQLRDFEFAMDRFRTDTWEGRPVYVVGAGPGDMRSRQFWVDAERMVFVRMLSPVPNDSTRTQDLRFYDYRPAGRGWIAAQVEIQEGGKRVFHEEYSNIRVDLPLDSSLWVPDQWRTARHP